MIGAVETTRSISTAESFLGRGDCDGGILARIGVVDGDDRCVLETAL